MSNSKHKKPTPEKPWLAFAMADARAGYPPRFRTEAGAMRFMESGDASDMVPLYAHKDGDMFMNPEWINAPIEFVILSKHAVQIQPIPMILDGLPSCATPPPTSSPAPPRPPDP